MWGKVSQELSLKSTVKEIRGEYVVLTLEKSGSEILWPKEFFPADIKVGDQVPLSVGGTNISESDRAMIARKILEELVN